MLQSSAIQLRCSPAKANFATRCCLVSYDTWRLNRFIEDWATLRNVQIHNIPLVVLFSGPNVILVLHILQDKHNDQHTAMIAKPRSSVQDQHLYGVDVAFACHCVVCITDLPHSTTIRVKRVFTSFINLFIRAKSDPSLPHFARSRARIYHG